MKLDRSTSFTRFLINRINSTRIIMFRSFVNEIKNKHEISNEDSTNEFSTNSCRVQHEYDQETRQLRFKNNLVCKDVEYK
jgi:hypothetical protein